MKLGCSLSTDILNIFKFTKYYLSVLCSLSLPKTWDILNELVVRKVGKVNIYLEYFVIYKYLLLLNYSQLFGEEDADQEVSPDRADPEASCE